MQYNKIMQLKYNQRYNYIRTVQLPKYLSREGKEESQQLLAQVRCGLMETQNRYWKETEKGENEKRECEEVEWGISTWKIVMKQHTRL